MSCIPKKLLVWDAHAGLFPSPDMDLNILEDWHRCNVNYLSINVGFDVMSPDETMATLAAYRRWLLAHSERFLLAEKFSDVRKAQHSKRLAISFDIEGMNALGSDINMVEIYHQLGVRQMLFAYNLNFIRNEPCWHDRGCKPYKLSYQHGLNRTLRHACGVHTFKSCVYLAASAKYQR